MRDDHRDGHDRGAAVVEFALILPVLMMLVVGMVSGAAAWNQNQALGQGARVAGRVASTLPLPGAVTEESMSVWLDDIADRAIAASEGQLATGVDGRAVCVAYVDPAGAEPDQTSSWRIAGDAAGAMGNTACFDDGQGDHTRRVQVVLERHGVLDVGFHRQGLELRRSVVYRYEVDDGL